jgi:hypothetical protein
LCHFDSFLKFALQKNSAPRIICQASFSTPSQFGITVPPYRNKCLPEGRFASALTYGGPEPGLNAITGKGIIKHKKDVYPNKIAVHGRAEANRPSGRGFI